MKEVFRDNELQKQLDKDGYVRSVFLSEKDINHLEYFYKTTPFQVPENNFFSTMHINDPAYREQVDREIKQVMTPYLNELLADYTILFANFLFKKPSSDSLVGIHQDWTYVDENHYRSVNIWIPFMDVGPENGTLAVLKGSHLLTAPVRYTPYELPQYRQYFDAIENKCEVLEVKRGEAIIYYSSLIHYSTNNQLDKGRLSMNMVVIPKSAQPVHFYKKNGVVKKYLIDKDLYLKYPLFEEPHGYQVDENFNYDPACFNADDLNRL